MDLKSDILFSNRKQKGLPVIGKPFLFRLLVSN